VPKKKIAPGFWWDADARIGFADFRVGGRRGRRVRAVFTDLTYRAALSAFGDLQRAEKDSPATARELPTFKAYWTDYPRLRPIKASTRKLYGYMLDARLFGEIADVRIDRITTGRILELRSRLMASDLSPASVNRHITLVRMLLNEARLRGLLREHPVPSGAVRPLKEPAPVIAYLSSSERAAFLAAFDDESAFRGHVASGQRMGPVRIGAQSPRARRYGGGPRGDSEAAGEAFRRFQAAKPLFLCALDTGLSRADLISLSWHQVDLESRTIRASRTKTGVSLVLPMTSRLHETLRRLAPGKSHEPVFKTAAGERWSEVSLKRYFALAKTLSGTTRPFRFHDMRHDFASALAQQGVSLYVIAQLLGHTSPRMTLRYSHLHPSNLRAAIDQLPGR
jgi:integrase